MTATLTAAPPRSCTCPDGTPKQAFPTEHHAEIVALRMRLADHKAGRQRGRIHWYPCDDHGWHVGHYAKKKRRVAPDDLPTLEARVELLRAVLRAARDGVLFGRMEEAS
ncbi:MAG TPA: hypothetical protein VGB14_13340 [Acidimicrobiales bacterium]